MRDLTVDIITDYKVTPEQVAELVESMSSKEQATFLNHLAARSNKWRVPFQFQLQAITDEKNLTDGARYLMEQIGAYANDDTIKSFPEAKEAQRQIGWVLNPAALHWVAEKASNMTNNICEEEVEAITRALIDLKYMRAKKLP